MVQTKEHSGISHISFEANGKKATLTGKQWDDLTERLIAGEHIILTDGDPDAQADVPVDNKFGGDVLAELAEATDGPQ